MASQIAQAHTIVNQTQEHEAQPYGLLLVLVGIVGMIALALSIYLAGVSLGWVQLKGCGTGSCTAMVLQSSWSRWLGIPVSVFAVVVYMTMLPALAMTRADRLGQRRFAWSVLLAVSVILAAAGFWFVGLMALHLRKGCGHCMGVHMLGLGVACILMTMCPFGRHNESLLPPRRAVGVLVIALCLFGVFIGGQILTAVAEHTVTASRTALEASMSPSAHRDHDTGHDVDLAAASASSARDAPDPNTPAGKAAIMEQLKRDHGDNWNRPTAPCDFLAYNSTRPNVRVHQSGLQYELLRKGGGKAASKNDLVRMHFRGSLWTGEVFYDTYALGKPQDIIVHDLIPGLAEMVVMMNPGSRWKVILPPRLAYDMIGLPGYVPSDYHVVYDLELLEVLSTPQGAVGNPTQAATPQEPR